MNSQETYLFSLLKQHITTTFLASHTAENDIRMWKGNTITDFQEDLRRKTKGSISEKWFYTYIKKETAKLPRIDMLNLLSVYVGYNNWNDFVQQHVNKDKIEDSSKKAKTSYQKFMWLLLLPFVAFGIYRLYPTENIFSFCFVDADQQKAITKIPLDIVILRKHESPVYIKTDSLGCFSYTTTEDELRFVVKSPYHKTDTIVRHINSSNHKTVKLQTDDYALMLLYYANGNKEDWQKRRDQLNMLIDDQAQIYRVFKNNLGIELYTKKEFINLLTIPTSTLKKMHVLDKVYVDNKIVKLKFMIQ
ncbi:hypothetical protein [Kordia zhangzhouensis]|uniref:hypothetical protein n=1 Tax=Kordia zhangzhouensis TaxID=1620405 RepID=UPI000A89EFF3|nr:hypothetical protein [Kordia zhangzhouensis]